MKITYLNFELTVDLWYSKSTTLFFESRKQSEITFEALEKLC